VKRMSVPETALTVTSAPIRATRHHIQKTSIFIVNAVNTSILRINV
jgi:hypothetical protein